MHTGHLPREKEHTTESVERESRDLAALAAKIAPGAVRSLNFLPDTLTVYISLL